MPNDRTWFGGIEISISDNRVPVTLDSIKQELLLGLLMKPKETIREGCVTVRLFVNIS